MTGQRRRSAINDVWQDIAGGALRYELWWRLAQQDLVTRYRRSYLGSLWAVASFAIFALVLGELYANLFQVSRDVYVPYLTTGLLVWNQVTAAFMEGSRMFYESARYLKALKLEFSIFLYRFVARNFLIFCLQGIVFLVVAVTYGVELTATSLLVLPGLVLLFLAGAWIGLVCGIVSARFRDFAEIINNVMRLAFFVTPIIWTTDRAESRGFGFVLDYNPFYHFLQTIRAPILDGAVETSSWLVVAIINVVGCTIALVMFARLRNRITLWL